MREAPYRGSHEGPFRGTVVPPRQSAGLPAQIHISSFELIAIVEGEAAGRYTIPLDELDLQPGGFDGEFVFCRRRSGEGPTLSTKAPGFVEGLAALAGARLDGELAKVSAHRISKRRWQRAGIAVVALFFVMVGIALWSVPRLLAASVMQLPTEIDQSLGDAAWEQMELEGPVVEDPLVVGFVEEIVGRLEPHASVTGFEYEVTVVDSETINAFALPGGHIVVFTGLIETASRPEQVAGVLAHEMSHVTRRHGMRNMAMSASLMVGLELLLGDASGWLIFASEVGALAMQNAYSREQESDADAEGVRMLVAARLDPEGLAEFFELLEGQAGSELSGALNWLSTHPDHRARIDHVHELARELGGDAPSPLETDFEAVQAALAD